jgi:hypothetical protein
VIKEKKWNKRQIKGLIDIIQDWEGDRHIFSFNEFPKAVCVSLGMSNLAAGDVWFFFSCLCRVNCREKKNKLPL